MDFSEYQELVKARDQNYANRGELRGQIVPLLGLTAEAGSIVNVYKRFLRDRINKTNYAQFMRVEMGDLLWHIAAVANSLDMNLDDIVSENLERIRELYPASTERPPLPHLDRKHFPEDLHFPRNMEFRFVEKDSEGRGPSVCDVYLTKADGFSNGGIADKLATDGEVRLGDPLNDNSMVEDYFRYHDAVHMAFVAILGWSPNIRNFLDLRNRDKGLEEISQTGPRARILEEALVASLWSMAKKRNGFLSPRNLNEEALGTVKELTVGLHAENVSLWIWRAAISSGFQVAHDLIRNKGGRVALDLDKGTIEYLGASGNGLPVADTNIINAIQNLHSVKAVAYAGAWKKRGEVRSILGNLSRKVDRLESWMNAGHETPDESVVDTACDLFIYCAKYEAFLMDEGAEGGIIDSSGGNNLSDDVGAMNDIISSIWKLAIGDYNSASVGAAVAATLAAFEEVEASFEDLSGQPSPTRRLARLRNLSLAACSLVICLFQEQPSRGYDFIQKHGH